MTLRSKLLLAQAPLGAAIIALGVVSVVTVTSVGETSGRILKDNYRSVLAMQRMVESIERLDSAALFLVAGQRDKATAQAAVHRRKLEDELEVQEGNITESGEQEMTRRLRAAWTGYRGAFDRFAAAPSASAYFADLEPRFDAVKAVAGDILALNQDAMAHKSDQARRFAAARREIVTWVSLVALILGLLASFTLLRRLLRPLDRLGGAVRRVAEGDLAARAAVVGTDEIARLAAEFNEMASRLEAYRKSSLGELLQAQQTSQAAIDSLVDPVVVFAVDGRVLSSNQAADAMLTLDGSTADPLELAPPDLRATLEQVVDHVRSGRGPYQPRGFDEAVMVIGAEGKRHLLARAMPLHDEEGGVAGVTVILQDVTRLRRFDELRNDLVATVAHELRTPLTSLRMAIHLAVEGAAGELNPKQLDILGAAREDCERLQTIVDDLLDLARFQSGRVELDRHPTRPEKLVSDAIDAHRADAEHRGVHLVAQVTSSLGSVAVDAGRLGLVFANFISNALRHTPAGGRVTVSAEPMGDKLGFAVTDNGPGIAAEHLGRVFDRFYRVPGTTGAGAGLGLSIAREIVEAHGGEIHADSAPGQGARFWFTLPTSASAARVVAS